MVRLAQSVGRNGDSPVFLRSIGTVPAILKVFLVAVGLAAFVGRWAAADGPDRYASPPPSAWPNQPIAVSADAPSSWPRNDAAPGAPRMLPAGYQSPEQPQGKSGRSDAPQAAEMAGGPGTIPLSRASNPSPSPWAGFSADDVPSFVNAATSLGIVLGLFLMVMWAVRRGMPKGDGLLPREAVEVLGRAPLVGRQQVHLVRCGNKMVLLNVTPTGVETLTEISDPAEVDRLHSICQPPTAGGGLRHWLGHFTGASRSLDYYPHDGSNTVDFGHLEPGQHRS